MPATQSQRRIAIGTPLGEDALLLHSIHGTERLGRPYEYRLVLLSEEASIDFNAILGQSVTVRIDTDGQDTRYINGYLSRFSQAGTRGRLNRYEATLVPWVWFLSRTSDCRIWQDKTVPQIVKQIFADHGFTDVSESLSESYPPRPYCVQYRETCFNFVSRLLEQEGIYYFFRHENGKHTLVLADSASAHEPLRDEEIPFEPAGLDEGGECISDWQISSQVQPGAVAQTDYDFTAPKKDLKAASKIERSHGGAGFEIFDYPGAYTESGDGERYARVRIEELQASQETVRCRGNVQGLSAGHTFRLGGHPREDQAREYLVVASSLSVVNAEFESGGEGGGEVVFGAEWEVLDLARPFRPARTAAKPMVQGAQTAIVSGSAGEEIWTDSYGRVKVQFMWDRYGKRDENSSCWVRVAQPVAGKKWGSLFIPRVGQEVVVHFLDGDPDRPIVAGCVYNADAMPPQDLPGSASRSSIRSCSTPGGGGGNEIRFEDKAGAEYMFLNAQYDRHDRVGNDFLALVGQNMHLVVKGDRLELAAGDVHVHHKSDRLEKVDGNLSETVGGDHQVKTGGKEAVEAGSEIHLKAGMTLILEAGMQLSLKVGGNFIDIGPAGISISGTLVNINSGGSAGSGGGSAPDAPKDASEAMTPEAGAPTPPPPPPTPPSPNTWGATAQVQQRAAEEGRPFTEVCEEAPEEEEEEQQMSTGGEEEPEQEEEMLGSSGGGEAPPPDVCQMPGGPDTKGGG